MAHPVSAVHRLRVNVRVPVLVVKYNKVRALQVDAQAASPCRHEEDNMFAVRSVELLHIEFTNHLMRRAI